MFVSFLFVFWKRNRHKTGICGQCTGHMRWKMMLVMWWCDILARDCQYVEKKGGMMSIGQNSIFLNVSIIIWFWHTTKLSESWRKCCVARPSYVFNSALPLWCSRCLLADFQFFEFSSSNKRALMNNNIQFSCRFAIFKWLADKLSGTIVEHSWSLLIGNAPFYVLWSACRSAGAKKVALCGLVLALDTILSSPKRVLPIHFMSSVLYAPHRLINPRNVALFNSLIKTNHPFSPHLLIPLVYPPLI